MSKFEMIGWFVNNWLSLTISVVSALGSILALFSLRQIRKNGNARQRAVYDKVVFDILSWAIETESLLLEAEISGLDEASHAECVTLIVQVQQFRAEAELAQNRIFGKDNTEINAEIGYFCGVFSDLGRRTSTFAQTAKFAPVSTEESEVK